MAYVSTTSAPVAGIFHGIASLYKAVVEEFGKRAEYHRTQNELYKLSKRELDDLGICHSDIDRIAYNAAYGH